MQQSNLDGVRIAPGLSLSLHRDAFLFGKVRLFGTLGMHRVVV